jgi:hypothetical protein
MTLLRTALTLGGVAFGLTAAAAPASAQFFLRSHDFRGDAVTGTEANLGQILPDATRAELNVAALQCQFEPTLLTRENYNAILLDHKDELATVWTTVTKYFTRTAKTPKAGQTALDQFGTRTYSNFATVAAQYNFCQTASEIGRDAIFAPRGGFAALAASRTRELRNSLIPYGEQHFQRYLGRDYASNPRLDPICWNKKGEWVAKKCGVFSWPPAGTAVTTRGTLATETAAR